MQPEPTIARLVRDQQGVVSRSQALASGLTREQVQHLSERGLLIRTHEGVFRHSAVPESWRTRLMAAVLASGDGAVASHRSAARLRDFRDIPRWRPEVTILDTTPRSNSGVIVHRTDLLDVLDVDVVDGIPCTSGPRTLLDLGAVVPFGIVQCAVQDAVIRDLVTHAQLFAVLDRVGKRGRRGTAKLRRVVRHALPDEKLESELERRLLALFPPNHGFLLQYELTCVDGRRVRLDAARPDLKLAVEGNGHRWHSTAKDTRRDLERRRSIKASGWDLWEYGWSDVVETPMLVTAQIAALIEPST